MIWTPLATKLSLLGALLVGALLFASHYMNMRQENAALSASVEQGNRTATATTDITAFASDATEASTFYENAIGQQQAGALRHYEDLRRENEPVRAWTDARIPDELRAYARCRREARERLGRLAAGSGGTDAGAFGCGNGATR